jgi:hypothetical protein
MLITDENEAPSMGIQSQQRAPGKQKMKHRQGKMNSFFKPNQAASIQKPSVMNGMIACKGCIHHHSSVYKHGHDLTCPKSEYFGMTAKQKSDSIKEKKQMQALKKPPSAELANLVVWQSTALGSGFFKQKQQSTAASAVVLVDTVSPPTVRL